MDNEIVDNFPFPKGEYHSSSEIFDAATEPYEKEIPKQRGGKREGAGRKRVYNEQTTRLKCKRSISGIVNAFIRAVDSWPEMMKFHTYGCRFDGSLSENKGKGLKKWNDNDAINSTFSISLEGKADPRKFALAFYLTNPEGVRVNAINPRSAELKWQRMDEVVRVMAMYGFLMAKSRLTDDQQSLINTMQFISPKDGVEWIEENMKH